jgi:integrase/recombinase XerD
MQYLSIEQVSDVLRVAFKGSRAHHLMLLLSFSHGLRRSEIANLTLGDVQDGRIRVQRVKHSLFTDQPLMASKNVLFDEPKALAAWMQERAGNGDALFLSRKGHGHFEPESISRIASYYMLKAGVPSELAHHHSLKHALASLMIRSKVDLSYVKQALGHRSISSTIQYVHISDREATEQASAAIQVALR